MNVKEKLTGAWQAFRLALSKLGKGTRRAIAAVLAIALLAVAVLVILRLTRPYTVLFTGLSSEDTAAVLSYLQEKGVTKYRVEGNDTILVPENLEAGLKAQLLMQGYPKSGFAYSTYLDHVGSLSTAADRQILFLYDLQDRMGATIRCLDGVKNAVVTLTPGEDRGYVLDSGNVVEATAAVFVTMEGAQTLTSQQAAAIRNLVAFGAEGLKVENIRISDAAGNTYSGGDGTGSADASQLKLALEEQVNNKVRASILEVLVPLFGAENLRVSVNSTVDVSRTYGESTVYTSPEGAPQGEGLIGSKVYDHTISRESGGGVGGVPGTSPNSDLPAYVESGVQPNGDEDYIRTSGEEERLVNSNLTQTDRSAGIVTDVMVAVSVNSTAAGSFNTVSLRSHIARAAGIGSEVEGEKISILPMAFYDAGAAPVPSGGIRLPGWTLYAAAAGLAVFLLALLLLVLLRRRRGRRRRETPAQPVFDFAVPAPAQEPQGADIMNIRTERSMELRKDIRQFAEANPEIAAQMVRGWLRGGEEGNG